MKFLRVGQCVCACQYDGSTFIVRHSRSVPRHVQICRISERGVITDTFNYLSNVRSTIVLEDGRIAFVNRDSTDISIVSLDGAIHVICTIGIPLDADDTLDNCAVTTAGRSLYVVARKKTYHIDAHLDVRALDAHLLNNAVILYGDNEIWMKSAADGQVGKLQESTPFDVAAPKPPGLMENIDARRVCVLEGIVFSLSREGVLSCSGRAVADGVTEIGVICDGLWACRKTEEQKYEFCTFNRLGQSTYKYTFDFPIRMCRGSKRVTLLGDKKLFYGPHMDPREFCRELQQFILEGEARVAKLQTKIANAREALRSSVLRFNV